ncbi:MAG TPA: Gfo/Idh/MocA family oxidoreductase [Acidimicrobiales bacterium]|nr:Gfo/Idh/MocA family oxidoreductase [Acidimicrobiales bacterium]
MDTDRVRIGVIGNGDAASMVIGDVVSSNHFEVVGAVDTDPRARARFVKRFDAPACESIEELLDRIELDGVYIATPTKLHEQQTNTCLEAGVHVLVEKPISTSLEAAESMIALAKAKGLTLMVCHKRSVDRPIIAMWRVIESGELGRVQAVHRWHFTDWFYRPRGFDEREPGTGGVVLRQGAHEYDIIRLLAGSPARSLRGMTGDYDLTRRGEGAYYSWIEHEDGVIATSIYGGYGHFHSDEFTKGLGDGTNVGLSRRTLDDIANTPELEAELKRAESEIPGSGPGHGVYGFTLVNCEGGDMRPAPTGSIYIYGDSGRREVDVDGIAGTEVIVEEFYRAITARRAPLHDGEWGLACLEECLAVRASMQRPDLVPLTHQGKVSESAARELLGQRQLHLVTQSLRS